MGNEMTVHSTTISKTEIVRQDGERNLQHSSRNGTATAKESSAARKKQYISEFDREMAKYLKGGDVN